MHYLLERLFKKNNISDITQLNQDEKITYDQLIKDLEKRAKPVTMNDWEEFLESQLEITIESFSPDMTEKKKDFMWSQIYLIQKLLAFIKRPAQEEEQIKKEYNIK